MIPRVLHNPLARIAVAVVGVIYFGLGAVAAILIPRGSQDEPLRETVLFKLWLFLFSVPLFMIGFIDEWLDDIRQQRLQRR